MSLVTITQGIGCGGGAIARKVAEALGVTLFDDDRLQREALEMGLHLAELKSLEEKGPGLFERLFSRRPEIYLDLMKSVVYRAAAKGEGVLFGHGGPILLQDFGCALHVLVHGSSAARVANLMKQSSIPREEAMLAVERSDAEKRRFFQFAFGREWADPSLYDLCIHIDKLGVNQAAELIVAAARGPEMKACSLLALDAMERLSLAKRVEAALREKSIPMAVLNVDVPEKGVAEVSGVVASPDDRERIPGIVRSVSGIRDVRVEVAVVTGGI
jgi:cytidylate kinase